MTAHDSNKVKEISARNHMEAEHARLASIVESSDDAIIGMSLNGIITNWNFGAKNIFGFSADEAMGKHIAFLVPPDRLDEIVLILEKLEGGGRVKHFETEFVTGYGRQIHVSLCISPIIDVKERVVGVSMIARDIDEHKMAELSLLESEERLKDSEDRLRLAIESTGLGMFDLRPLTGEMTLSNLFKEQLGLTPDVEVNFKLFLTGLHPEDRERVEQLVKRVLKPESGGEFRDEYRTIGIQDGRERWIEARGRVYFNASGNPVRIIGTSLDITERKRAEHEIAILDKRLAARASELETANMELEAFSYSVSHDLRKPLTVVNGYCQVILDLYKDTLDEQCRKFLSEIYHATERMDRLIDVLLRFALLIHSVMHREQVDLSSMAKHVIADLMLTEPGRKVTCLIAEGVKVEGDSNLMRIVMENLIGNAWKYTGMNEDTVIEFGIMTVEGIPTCFVKDNGIGFTMEHADKLFIPFHRLPGSDEFRGDGIGLATVRRIIQRHHGRIWAESEPGKGATFYFTVPAKQ